MINYSKKITDDLENRIEHDTLQAIKHFDTIMGFEDSLDDEDLKDLETNIETEE